MSMCCSICGRLIEKKEDKTPSGDWIEEALALKPKQKSTVFCQMCEAKLRKEADDSQKPRKPM
ncbi:hypothetical protein M1N70_03345 [Peptococcaceae bacterium]|nr:hypothetical protein [Peptococcaceae bacterium]